jgi:hypothetical protein
MDEKHNITVNMEKSVAKAYEEFAPKQAGPKQFNGILKRAHNPAACVHTWKSTGPLPKEHLEYLKIVTEDEPTASSAVKWCTSCGSVSYWENGELWLFDATTRYFGKPPKRRRHETNE